MSYDFSSDIFEIREKNFMKLKSIILDSDEYHEVVDA